MLLPVPAARARRRHLPTGICLRQQGRRSGSCLSPGCPRGRRVAPPLSACRGSFVQKAGFKCQAGSVGLCRRSDVSLNSSTVLTKTLLPLPSARSKLCRGRAGDTNPGVCACVCTALSSSSPSPPGEQRGCSHHKKSPGCVSPGGLHPGSYPDTTSSAARAGPGAVFFQPSPLPPRSALPFQASDGERG